MAPNTKETKIIWEKAYKAGRRDLIEKLRYYPRLYDKGYMQPAIPIEDWQALEKELEE